MKSADIRKHTTYFYILMFVAALTGMHASVSLAADEVDMTDKEVSQEIKEAAQAIGEYSIEQKDAAVAKAKEMMENIDERMDKWEKGLAENWGDLRQTGKKNYHETMKSLRHQRNNLSEWYGSMKHSSKEAWQDVKEGFSKTYESLMRSWKDAEKEMDTRI